MTDIFRGNFTQQEPIPDEAIAAALTVLKHGRLHRYNEVEGEVAESASLELEFAAQMGSRYCLAVASGGYALATALRSVGVKPGDKVLTNAFTLAPVPGAIASVGAVPVFVGVTDGLVIDLEDLASKAGQADVLMLSHMRGHIVDMDALMQLAQAHNLLVIEDCAHTMGAKWGDTRSGRSGVIGCYSCQTYKHVNSGEGGLLICDDDEIMARAIMLSGSYMIYAKHRAGPPPEAFEAVRLVTPNISGRMDNLRAAILRPQLRRLDSQCQAWNDRYHVVDSALGQVAGLTRVQRPQQEKFVASSYQFLLLDWSGDAIRDVVARCLARGVELKWFGAVEPVGFTSRYDSWTYAPSSPMPSSDRVLHSIIDMRLPLMFSLEDCVMVARIIGEEVALAFAASGQNQA
ncbi:MAG: aminotransferase class I/II-fold pyridoxal phosphate-dependent enzyme [Planktomarina sp.]|nr:aminotransferase class I/II-fold pyridoxal phosphate-dependent enzyme [Planktomarina sp.]